MFVFVREFKWSPAEVLRCRVGDLDLLWRSGVDERFLEGGD